MYSRVYPILELWLRFTAVIAVNYLALYLKWPALSEHHAHRTSHLFISTKADKGGDTDMPQS